MSTAANIVENEHDTNETKIIDSNGNGLGIDMTIDYSIKHPLHNCWVLWFFDKGLSQDWQKNQKEIASFQTVEDFWSMYNFMKQASEIGHGNDYSIFKKGIRPMWEDAANKDGGRWLLSLERRQRSPDLDRYWLDVMLCLIGEAFDNSNEICGAVVNVRNKGDKIAIWTSDYSNSASVLEIGTKIKERLNLSSRITLCYQVHKDTMDKVGSVTKSLYNI